MLHHCSPCTQWRLSILCSCVPDVPGCGHSGWGVGGEGHGAVVGQATPHWCQRGHMANACGKSKGTKGTKSQEWHFWGQSCGPSRRRSRSRECLGRTGPGHGPSVRGWCIGQSTSILGTVCGDPLWWYDGLANLTWKYSKSSKDMFNLFDLFGLFCYYVIYVIWTFGFIGFDMFDYWSFMTLSQLPHDVIVYIWVFRYIRYIQTIQYIQSFQSIVMAICEWHGSPRVSPRGCARWLGRSFATSFRIFRGHVGGDPVCDVCDVFVYSIYFNIWKYMKKSKLYINIINYINLYNIYIISYSIYSKYSIF